MKLRRMSRKVGILPCFLNPYCGSFCTFIPIKSQGSLIIPALLSYDTQSLYRLLRKIPLPDNLKMTDSRTHGTTEASHRIIFSWVFYLEGIKDLNFSSSKYFVNSVVPALTFGFDISSLIKYSIFNRQYSITRGYLKNVI